jgi:uncharacterized protein
MRFSLDVSDNVNSIRAYRNGCITVNDQEVRRSMIVMPDRLITDWRPQSLDQIMAEDFGIFQELQPEIILLGTGERHRFPDPRLLQPILRRGLGLEVMTTVAACRTYNIVVAEGRRVAAALIIS